MVVIAENNIHKKFAIKFYRPDVSILRDSIERFIREIRILAELTHKNIVKVYTGGKAVWDEENNKWIVTEGLDDIAPPSKNEVLYYIMDFIKGEDISSIFPELRKNKSEVKEIPLYRRLILFEEMISQITSAMNYYHSKNITHKDIKPDNIRYSTEDSTFIIVDFGFARPILLRLRIIQQ